MRTTLDLPDDLLRQAKIVAVQRGTTLRDLVAQALRQEILQPMAVARPKPLPALHLADDAPVLQMSPAQITAVSHQLGTDDDAARVG